MAPKADLTKAVEDVTKAVEDLQQDVSRIAELEKNVAQILGQMSILGQLDQHMRDEKLVRTQREALASGSTTTTEREKQRDNGDESSAATANQTGPAVFSLGLGPITGNVSTTESSRTEPLTRKLEIPVFYGENAESWVLRVEQYFNWAVLRRRRSSVQSVCVLTMRLCYGTGGSESGTRSGVGIS